MWHLYVIFEGQMVVLRANLIGYAIRILFPLYAYFAVLPCFLICKNHNDSNNNNLLGYFLQLWCVSKQLLAMVTLWG